MKTAEEIEKEKQQVRLILKLSSDFLKDKMSFNAYAFKLTECNKVIRVLNYKDKGRYSALLFKLIEEAFKVNREQIISVTRKAEVVLCRQLFCFFMVQSELSSLKEIGDMIGGRDHTTVLYSNRLILNYINIGDQKITEAYTKLNNLLKNI